MNEGASAASAEKGDSSNLERHLERSGRASTSDELFTATAAHDLRAPLNLIQTGITLLRSELAKSPNAKNDQILTGMSKGVAQMRLLIDDMLSFAKSHRELHHLELLDLNEVVKSCLINLKLLIEKNNARFVLEELPVICADRTQIQQLFQNLFENSLKYRRAEIDPVITVRNRAAARDELNTKACYWEISVQDNGRGFTNNVADTLFEPYRRLTNAGVEGSGLGLAICKRVVEGHRGRIHAEGTPGEGARFVIRLPSIECCLKSHDCPFAASAHDKKCPAL